MFWASKVIAPLALVAGMAVTTSVLMADAGGNQPPFGKGGKGFPGKGGDDKKKGEDKKGDKKFEEKKGPPAPKSDAVVDAWLVVLLAKITDPHDTVRDSARGAIVAVGAPALPALQKLADGDDPAKAVAAHKLIAAIHGHGHHGPGGHPVRGRAPITVRGQRVRAAPAASVIPARAGAASAPGTGGRGPGGFGPPGPGGRGGPGGPGGERGRGPGWGGRDEGEDVEIAPMPRDAANG
ncbi:hypothetical protein [Frigoriglobus tundricola]|uniref:Uncharacterized protein n=1 Tax=Frigoriglobus tundricola TaxID=2774151 RepID=A0A6M5YUX4_9BACT|nr:hypothetical protein [Frigoriglobus tundricola]QJW97729.1 hypothetical protein FTUN_5307 [Frigoriglobus tundricola]